MQTNIPVIAATFVALSLPLDAAAGRKGLDEEPQFLDGHLVLPAWETSWERNVLLSKDTEAQLNAFRTAHPEIYGVTDPPVQPVTFYAEFDPVDAVYYAWEPGVFDEFFQSLTHEILSRTDVDLILLHHGATDRASIETMVTAGGDDPSLVTFIDTSTLGTYYVWETEWPWDRSLESFWTVDYGPYFVEDGDGVISIVDPRYVAWRVNDDAIPTKLATLMGVNAFRPDLDWDGGNLFSDGAGTCFATGLHVAENIPLTEAEIEDGLAAYFGCEKTIWLDPTIGDGTGHIDMFFKLASPTTAIVGEFDPGVDDYNASILDANAARLSSGTNAAGDPIEVQRVPMPPDTDGVFRSYTNGILVNDLVLVPVYPAHAENEAEALAVIEAAFPGRTVVGIDSEGIIEWGGAIHCVTRTRPAGTQAVMEEPPDLACSGAFQCVGGCGDVDFIGECVYGLPVYCDAGSIYTEACYLGERCGWDLTEDYNYCVTEGCAPLPPAGECRATPEGVEFAVTCVDGYPAAERCEGGMECVREDPTGAPACVEPCADDCATGEGGCLSGTAGWTCGDAGDGDDCLDRVAFSCGAGEACAAGECACTDACVAGEAGCEGDLEAFACADDDLDGCLERITVACGEGTHCEAGACVEDADPSSGCGCSVVG